LSSLSFGVTGTAGPSEGRTFKTVAGTTGGVWLRSSGVVIGDAGCGFGPGELERRIEDLGNRRLVTPASDGMGLAESVVGESVSVGSSAGSLVAAGIEITDSEFAIFGAAGAGFELSRPGEA